MKIPTGALRRESREAPRARRGTTLFPWRRPAADDRWVVQLVIGARSPTLRDPVAEVSSNAPGHHLEVLIRALRRHPPDVAGSSACEKAVHKLCSPWAQDIGVPVLVASIAISHRNAGLLQP